MTSIAFPLATGMDCAEETEAGGCATSGELTAGSLFRLLLVEKMPLAMHAFSSAFLLFSVCDRKSSAEVPLFDID